MAGPVMHTLLALQLLSFAPRIDKSFADRVDPKAFLVGTNFPDIRYLATTPREKTHFEPVSLEDVLKEKSSFRAGMLFHNLVDKYRVTHLEDEFFEELKSLLLFKQHMNATIMKIAEDALSYEKISPDQWREIADYFDTLYEEEGEFVEDIALIKEWHIRLQAYFSVSPSLKSFEKLVDTHLNWKVIWLKKIGTWLVRPEFFEKFIKNEHFKSSLEEFYKSAPYNLLMCNSSSLSWGETSRPMYA